MTITPKQIADNIETINAERFYSSAGVQITPLLHSQPLSQLHGANVYFKCEHRQTTGSFKMRGATNALLNLTSAQRRQGIVTASSGNHGATTVKAAVELNIPVTVFVPQEISPAKAEKISALGATLVKVPGQGENAEREALLWARQQQQSYISPYNDVNIITGQGSIAKELMQQLPQIDVVFASVGGGGLISGIGSYFSQFKPQVEIVGCWPENAPAMLQCIKAGKVVQVKEQPTLSDGTAGGIEPGSITLPLCMEVIDTSVCVNESMIAKSMYDIMQYTGDKVEGAAGVALAGFEQLSRQFQGKNVVIILCGGNIDQESFDKAIQQSKEIS
jgi:threonine dehydratase